VNLTTIRLKELLLGNSISSATFETLLASASYRSAWGSMCNRRAAIKAIAGSAVAMAIVAGSTTASTDLLAFPESKTVVFQSGKALKAIVNNATGRTVWAPTLSFMLASNPGLIKLKRQVFTASGTWTYPAHVAPGALEDVRTVCVGGGGGGAGISGAISGAGGGGGGGALVATVLSPASLTISQAITVGAAGTGSSGTGASGGGTTSFGAFASAAGGSPGTGVTVNLTVGAGGAGGGAASSGNWYSTAILTAAWQDAAVVRGGAGGAGHATTGVTGGSATSANALTLGAGGAGGVGSAAQPGGPYSGGGGGGSYLSGSGAIATATSYGAGGSGAGNNGSGSLTGRDGVVGCCVVHWIEP
jgi:hypothetical protein